MSQAVNPESGLTNAEEHCHDSLMQAYSAFLDLPVYHPCEQQEFAAAIHELQGLFAIRIAARSYPKLWMQDVADETSDGRVHERDFSHLDPPRSCHGPTRSIDDG